MLETLFDDDRLHLTEKSLRPIACGQPFILAATHGSLEYLRSYGFKTFDGIIDESYDLIEDPLKRLQAIIYSMNQIAAWSKEEQHYKLMQMQQIADYNRQYFFSDEFFNLIIKELTENLINAFSEFDSIKSCNNWINLWDQLLLQPAIIDFLENNNEWGPTRKQIDIIYQIAKNMSNNGHLIQR